MGSRYKVDYKACSRFGMMDVEEMRGRMMNLEEEYSTNGQKLDGLHGNERRDASGQQDRADREIQLDKCTTQEEQHLKQPHAGIEWNNE